MNTMEIWNYILFKIKFTSEMKFFLIHHSLAPIKPYTKF